MLLGGLLGDGLQLYLQCCLLSGQRQQVGHGQIVALFELLQGPLLAQQLLVLTTIIAHSLGQVLGASAAADQLTALAGQGGDGLDPVGHDTQSEVATRRMAATLLCGDQAAGAETFAQAGFASGGDAFADLLGGQFYADLMLIGQVAASLVAFTLQGATERAPDCSEQPASAAAASLPSMASSVPPGVWLI